jgi:radical SAM superfamily enzyme YgiQ (UPF0313 family)
MTYNSVALVSLPRQDLLRPPAALPVLAAVCEKISVDYSIWDFNLWLKNNCDQVSWEAIDSNWIKIDSFKDTKEHWFAKFTQLLNQWCDQLIKSKPDLVAISIFTDWSAHCAYEMICAIKARSNVPIVIGGTGIAAKLPIFPGQSLCDALLSQGLIEFYIYGEGEINFQRLLQNDLNWPGINNQNQSQIQDLNTLPMPSYNKIDPNHYLYLDRPTVMINGSRGCVRACTYCDVAHYWPQYRFKDGKLLADEIFHTWQKTGVRDFEFSDSLINGSVREFRKLNRRLIELKQQDPKFDPDYKGQFICRAVDQFKESDYESMAQAGCTHLYVGVESFSDSVRFAMDKKFDNEALDWHLTMTAKYGIPNVLLMIVGYPTETDLDHKINLEALKKYQKYALSGTISMITFGFTTSILNHTPLDEQRQELMIEQEFDDFVSTANWISLRNPSLTYKERVRRWIELTETADALGYRQPRIDSIVSRLEQVLTLTKNKKSKIHIAHA